MVTEATDQSEDRAKRLRGGGISYLDGERLARALLAGMKRLIDERDQLNRINVFPVADGDTGTNLALTMSSIAAAVRAKPVKSAGQLLVDVADAALDGARGNSGAIIAQFFQGLADAVGERRRLVAADLANALEAASKYAHDALDKPLEGTVLTVIGDVSQEAKRLADQGSGDLGKLMKGLLKRAEESLETTRNGLEQMRRANVVDAGARGFVLLLEGMVDFISAGSLREQPEPEMDIAEAAEMLMDNPGGDEVTYRFCTECMITGEDMDRRKLREALGQLGNSMVLAGTHRKLKVHIHTDDPAEVFAIAGEHGEVSGTKADDMKQQVGTIGHGRSGAAVVTDSAADLPDSAYEELGIHFVPLRVNFGERSYMDKVSLPPAEFYAELQQNPVFPRTSQPAPGDYRRVYEFLSSHFEQVISISLTSSASGTWQSAVAAAERVRGGSPVHVIDSKSVSVGQGLVATYAAECARAGLSGDALVNAVEGAVERTSVFGVVRDLTWAVRGGRITAWLKWIADALGILPIISLGEQGEVLTRSAVRRAGDNVRGFARHLRRKMPSGALYRITVGHANCPRDAQRLAGLLAQSFQVHGEIAIVEVSAALGTHGGPGTLVAGLQRYQPPPQSA